MANGFEGINIIVNYTSMVIDALLKDIPKIPAVLEQPYITRGSVSPKLHVPFKFADNIDKWYGVDPIYNSMRSEMVLSSSVNKRLLDIYNISINKDLVGNKVLIATEVLHDMSDGVDTLVLYSMSRPSNDISFTSNPKEKNSHIMNPDEHIIDILFRNIKAFPASIHSVTDPRIKPASTDYTVYFDFYDNINEVFAGKEYNLSFNNLAINKLMHILDVETPNECQGKDIAVYVSNEPWNRRVLICGMTSLEQYHTRSVKFQEFKNIR